MEMGQVNACIMNVSDLRNESDKGRHIRCATWWQIYKIWVRKLGKYEEWSARLGMGQINARMENCSEKAM